MSGEGLHVRPYGEIRQLLGPGDVIAFGGKGPGISGLIKRFTRAPVSHVGIVIQTREVHDPNPLRFFAQVIESTSLDGAAGVQLTRLSQRVKTYNGDMWWLPLSAKARKRLDLAAFWEFLFAQEGKGYDYLQAPLSALDLLDPIGLTHAEEDFAKFFCSELVGAGLREGGLLHPEVNPSEMTPIDVCRLAIYSERYVQIAGEETAIPGWNSDRAGVAISPSAEW